MKSLKEVIEDPSIMQSVLADSLRVLDEEVARRSGIGGMAIKAAYKVVKNVQDGRILEKAVRALIPEFIDALEPYYRRFQEEGAGRRWGAYLEPHYASVSDGLLSVTDRKIRETDNRMIRGTYDKLRPKARKEVVAAMPALTRMMERYL